MTHAFSPAAEDRLDLDKVFPIFAIVFIDMLGLTVILPLLHIYAAPLDVAAEEMVLTEGQRIAWVSLNEALELPLVAWVREVLPEFVASRVYRTMLDMQSRDS